MGVVGRKTPTDKDPEPEIYRMKIFSDNEVAAKSRFWYFLHKLRKMKKTTGDILTVKQIFEEKPNELNTVPETAASRLSAPALSKMRTPSEKTHSNFWAMTLNFPCPIADRVPPRGTRALSLQHAL